MTATTTPKLISSFAKFTLGDIKGGDAAHAFRLSQVTEAINQALKGNFDPMREAATLTEGKIKKARAYHAGFAAIAAGVAAGEFGTPTASGQLGRVAYTGALSLPENAPARQTIATHTATAVRLFDAAFLATMAEKAVKKAAPVVAPAPAPAAAPAGDVAASDDVETVQEVAVADIVETVVNAITMGALTPAEIEMIRVALATMPEQQPALLAA